MKATARHVNKTPEDRNLVQRGGGLEEFESQIQWYINDDVVVIFTINNHLGFRVPIINGIK